MTEILNEIKPGQPLSEEQRAALAKENEQASLDAHTQAAEHRQRDMENGNYVPPVQAVADSIKEKLLGEEFQPNERKVSNGE